MKIFLLLTFMLLSSPVLGQSNKSQGLVNSAEHRTNKQWQATFGPGSFSPFLGPRARFSLFLDPDALLFLDVSGGKTWNGLGSVYSYSKTITEGRKASVGYKTFLGNSFYVEGSGFYRLVFRSPNEFLNDIAFSSRAIGGELVLGNQWQFNRFTIGCDWIGFQAPLAILSQKSQNGDDSEYFRRKRRDFKSFSENVQLVIAGFYIGFSF